MKVFLEEFFQRVVVDEVDLYNEAIFQHELGFFLRNKLLGWKIHLERNITYLGLSKAEFTKKEIDLLLESPEGRKVVIELKAPIDQKLARPVTVFHWIEDLKFLEQLKEVGFEVYSIFLTNEKGYFSSGGNTGPLLRDFRRGVIAGSYDKHNKTIQKQKSITLKNQYQFEWSNLSEGLKYFIISV